MTTFGFPRGATFGRALAGVLCAGAILALAGCGRGPKLVKVTGKVSYQGKPYPHAFVWFIPESSPEGQQAAEGMADEEGKFMLATPNTGEGIAPGQYKVGLKFGIKGHQPPRDLQKYSSSKTTPITVDVPPEGLTDYEVKLR